MNPRPHHIDPKKETVRVVFSAKNFGSGEGISNIGLGVTNLNNVKVLRQDGYFAEVWGAQNAAQIHDQLHAAAAHSVQTGMIPPTHFIINSPSWVTTAELRDLAQKWPHVVFVLQNHTGTAYLQIDKNVDETGVAMVKKVADLERLTANVKLSANNCRFQQWATKTHRAPCLLLSNLYDTAAFVDPYPAKRDFGGTLRIGGFGASRNWKNQLTAAMGAVQLARQLGVNLDYFVNSGRSVDKNLNAARDDLFAGEKDVKLIEIHWEPWPEFRRTVGHMHLLMQPSFDETFNVVTADGIAAGVPSVTGECIEWSPPSWQASTCDPSDLVKVGLYLLHDTHAVEEGRAALKKYVRHGLDLWRDFLGA